MLSIFRLPESGLVLKNRESSLDIWTIEALKTTTWTSNTTAAICLSAICASCKFQFVQRSLRFVFVCMLCFLLLPSPSLRICLTAMGPVHAGNLYHIYACSYSTVPQGRAQIGCFRNTLLQSRLLLSGRANYSNARHLFRNLTASVLGTGAVLLLTYILCKIFHKTVCWNLFLLCKWI